MIKTKQITVVIFILFFLGSLVPSILFLSNKAINSNVPEINSDSLSLDVFNTSCYQKEEVLNKLSQKYGNLNFYNENRDIYLSQNFRNLFCLGNVVDFSIEGDNVLIYTATNPKISIASSITWIGFFIFLSFIKFKNKIFSIPAFIIIFYFSQNIINNRQFNLFDFFLLFITTFLLLMICFSITDKENYFKITKYFRRLSNKLSFDDYLVNVSQEKILSTLKLFNFILLLFVLVSTYYKKFVYFSPKYIFNDILIQIYTSAKMHYFNQTSFEAALNQHTPIIPYIYKFIYYIFDFSKFESGFGLIVILISIFSAFFMYLICDHLLKNKIISFQITIFFLIFMLDGNGLNRDLGILIYLGIVFNILKFLESKNLKNLMFVNILSVLQIYNLESFILTIIFLNIIILFFVNNEINYLKVSIPVIFFTIFILYSSFFINSEISYLLETNYLFHLQNINPDFPNSSIFNALGYSPVNKINFNHAALLGLVLLFLKSIRSKNFKVNKFEFILFGWLFVEILSLFITGPRFWNYGINLVLPTLLIYLFFFKEFIKSDNSQHLKTYLISLLFLTLFFNTNISNLSNYKNITDVPHAAYEESDKFLSIIEENNNEINLVLTWIHPGDWEWVYNSKTILPSTKYWWWFFMKYHQTEMYTWDKNWDVETVEVDFLEDLEKEKPGYAIVNTGIVEPPEFFKEAIKNSYKLVYQNSKFNLYKRD